MVRFEPGQHLPLIMASALADSHTVAFVPASPVLPARIDMMGVQAVAAVRTQLAPPSSPALYQVLPHLVENVNGYGHNVLRSAAGASFIARTSRENRLYNFLHSALSLHLAANKQLTLPGSTAKRPIPSDDSSA